MLVFSRVTEVWRAYQVGKEIGVRMAYLVSLAPGEWQATLDWMVYQDSEAMKETEVGT